MMVTSCVAYGCRNRDAKIKNKGKRLLFCRLFFLANYFISIFVAISFHRFPTDLTKRKIWEQRMRRKYWVAKPTNRLCSEHFDDSCFKQGKKYKVLVRNSVPTLFNFLTHLQPPVLKKPRVLQQLDTSTTPIDVDSENFAAQLQQGSSTTGTSVAETNVSVDDDAHY